MKKTQNLKYQIVKLFSHSSIDGVPQIVTSRNRLQTCIWLLSFLCAVAYCASLIIDSVISYYNFDVVYDLSIVDTHQVEFPGITFCNVNLLDYTNVKLKKLMNRTDWPLDLSEDFLTNLDRFNYTRQNMTNTLAEVAYSMTNIFKINTNYSVGFYSLNQMLISCTFNGRTCNTSYFITRPTRNYGVCYVFNTSAIYVTSGQNASKSARTGKAYGLNMELFVGFPDEQPFWVPTVGVVMAIHNRTTRPLVSEEGFKLLTGQQTNIMFNRLEMQKLSSPYSNCIMDVYSNTTLNTIDYRETLISSGTYNQRICIQRCLGKFDNSSQMPIRDFYMTDMTIFFTKSQYDYCVTACPEECVKISFDPSISYANYMNDNYLKSLLATNSYLKSLNRSVKDLKKSILSVNLKYNTLYTRVIRESPKISFAVMMANIGGQLGLWVGVSVLSFLEFFEVAFILGKYFLDFIVKK